ncbi:hypothetical protein [Streptomyces pseudogriseolus]|uniref:hypothetical protein n=1 Tax=Streptomyces pseudogriseolus TaxID=36817 RepID=UPI003FA25744
MPAATATDWLTAAAIGTSVLPLLAAAAVAADHDWHLPHLSPAGVVDTAEHTAAQLRLHAVALLLLLAWHLEPKEPTPRTT